MAHLFFSYSRKNSDEASRLIIHLRKLGFIIWQDVSDIRGGDRWQQAIQKGIRESDGVIVLWSAGASASEWVGKEIELASSHGKTLYPILLDDTPLSDGLSLYNGKQMAQIEALIHSFPISARRQSMILKWHTSIDDQATDGVERWFVDDVELVSVPLLRSSYSQASIVAPAQALIEQPATLHVCLQFSRGIDKVMISDVYRQARRVYPGEPFMALHIMGPVFLTEYRLDNDNAAQWLDAVESLREALQVLSQTRRPQLHIYGQIPAALAFGMGTKLWRFWHLHLYNWVKDGYVRVMEIMPEE